MLCIRFIIIIINNSNNNNNNNNNNNIIVLVYLILTLLNKNIKFVIIIDINAGFKYRIINVYRQFNPPNNQNQSEHFAAQLLIIKKCLHRKVQEIKLEIILKTTMTLPCKNIID